MSVLMIACFMPAAAFADVSTDCAGGDDCQHAAAITSGNVTTHYDTLLQAIDGAEEGSTITLLKNYEVQTKEYTSYLMPNGSVLNLGNNTLTVPFAAAVFEGENITIKNGCFASDANYGIWIGNGKNETSATLKNIKSDRGVNVFAASAVLEECTIDLTGQEEYYAVWGDDGNVEITIKSGTYIGGSKFAAVSASDGWNGGDVTDPAKIIIEGGYFGGEIWVYDGGKSYEEKKLKGEVEITGGLFNTKPDSTYCEDGYAVVASGNSKYPFTVAENKAEVKTADTAATEVKSEGANIEVTKGTDEAATEAETKAAGEAVSSAAEAVTGTTSEGLEVAAVTEAQKTVTEKTASEAKETLKAALQNVEGAGQIEDGTTVNIFVQPYLDITIADAKVETTTNSSGGGTTTTATVKELTLNIVPMVKTIASTANSAEGIVTAKDAGGTGGKTQNAVEVGTAKKVEVTTPVTITIPLPSGFVNSTEDKLYIEHTKSNGTSYVYTAAVTSNSEASPTYYATFTNPNGFSQFLITTEDASEAKIGDVGYTSLQAALAAAENGDTVTVLKDGLTASMSGSTRTIKLVNGMTGESDADSINVTINDKKITLAKNGEGESFTYTKRSSGGGSSAAVTPPAVDEAGDEAKTDEEIAAENAAKAAELASALKLTARSEKTAKGNIKVTLTVDSDAIRQIEVLGYTVKYKFYRSTKKAASYKAKYEKADLTYTNTAGTKGTRYYYKARVMVYDAQGALVAKSELKQCKYACRIK